MRKRLHSAAETVSHSLGYARHLLRGNRVAGDLSWVQPGTRPVVLLRPVPGDSVIHRLWAGTKLLTVFVLSALLTFYPGWVGIGAVAEDIGSIPAALPNAGFGIRLETEKRSNVRVDYGVGTNSSAFYVTFYEAF